MGHTIDGFRAAKFELSLRPVDPIVLPAQAGSTFRGGFGRAFLKVGCAAWAIGSGECTLGPRCPYHYIFETPVPSDSRILANVGTAPRPFVIEPPLDSPAVYEPGGVLPVGLILVGRAIDYFPYFIHAFEELGRLGLGRGRGRYRLESVVSIPAVGPTKPIYDGATRRLTSGIEILAADQTSPPAPEESVTVTRIPRGEGIETQPDFRTTKVPESRRIPRGEGIETRSQGELSSPSL